MARYPSAGKEKPGKRSKTGKGATAPPGRLRIVAGIWRSRVLEIADVPGLRPTPERIRETLFNWLAPVIAGSRCLDLFAGSGALGLEALSRGAASCVFVENSRLAAATLRRNIEALDADRATVLEQDARAFLEKDAAGRFDVVFLDPPFADDRIDELCRLLNRQGVLAQNAKVYLEQDRRQSRTALPAGWNRLKEKTAGNVRYTLLVTATEQGSCTLRPNRGESE